MTRVRRRPLVPHLGVVVGLDQSFTGFAAVVMHQDHTAVSFRKSFEPLRGVDRLGEIQDWLAGVFGALEPNVLHITMEGYAPGMPFNREKMGELGATVKLALRRLGDPLGYPTIVGTLAVKKFATGSGKAKKDQITKDVYRKWGYDSPNNDIADAYVLARVAHALQWGSDGLLAYEQEVVSGLTKHTERSGHESDDRDGSRAGAARGRAQKR